jgi:hypothetical protein
MNINNIQIFRFTCFDSSIDCIEQFLRAEFKKKIIMKKILVSRIEKDIDTVFAEFEEKRELNNQKSYEAFFFNPLIKSDKTIMISNLQDGWYTLGNVISIKLPCERYSFFLCDGSVEDPMNSLIYTNGKLERAVYSMKDGKWVFYQEGEPLPFEKLNYYKQRIIKKRVTKQILIDYCKELGLFIEDENFWKSTEENLYVRHLW